jgi:hypothetical protein
MALFGFDFRNPEKINSYHCQSSLQHRGAAPKGLHGGHSIASAAAKGFGNFWH